jgi:hypothetical protein
VLVAEMGLVCGDIMGWSELGLCWSWSGGGAAGVGS